jgi:hypothetical protein
MKLGRPDEAHCPVRKRPVSDRVKAAADHSIPLMTSYGAEAR